MNVFPLDQLVTVRNASVMAEIPRSTVYHFIRTGKVTPIIVDGVLFITRDDVARMAIRKAS